MSINPSQPIYLGVSQEFFVKMQDLNILDGDVNFTLSMAEAEENAKNFHHKAKERAKRGFAGMSKVLLSMFTSNTPPETITSKERGVVVKFNTAKLMNVYQLLKFGNSIRVSTEVIQSVMMYIEAAYEVVDIEELEPIDYA